MTAQRLTNALPRHVEAFDDPLVTAEDPLAFARQHVCDAALADSPGGRVGLELEFHLVDLARPERRPTWPEATALARSIGPLPSRSRVTLEPGGQIELSTPPAEDVVSSVAALRADREVLRSQLRDAGFGAAPVGADLARPVARINPSARYRAMEEHFDALGCAGSGKEMMTATAALQVNLDAGPARGWEARLALIRSMVPMLVAASSTSPYLAGTTTGWHSMRQGTWQGIDHGRSAPVPLGEPTAAWATYALDAPVMLIHNGSELMPVTERISFAQWLRGGASFGRRPTMADLEYHLTTLFPPVRPRGYIELRCLDAAPDRWWPALAVLTSPSSTIRWPPTLPPSSAPRLPTAGRPPPGTGCTTKPSGQPSSRAPSSLRAAAIPRCRTELEAFVELLQSGSSPSDDLRRRVEATTPLAVLEEEAHA